MEPNETDFPANDAGCDVVVPLRRARFAQVPLWVLTLHLRGDDWQVCVALCGHARDGRAYPSRHTLADETGILQRNVARSLRRLDAFGAIAIRPDGSYQINFERPSGLIREPSARLTREPNRLTREPPYIGTESRTDAGTERGHRIAETWWPDAEGITLAHELGFDLEWTVDKFRNFWLAADEQRAVKRDWNAAFRLWLQRETEFQARNHQHTGSVVSVARDFIADRNQRQTGSATLRALARIRLRGDEGYPPQPPFDGARPAMPIPWRERIEELGKTGIWRSEWGPTPHEPDCQLLANFWPRSAIKRWLENNPKPLP